MGLSLGEILLLLIVGIIVVGPRNLPTMMRTAGQWIARLRRMSSELRSQSGIDDLIRQEGLETHIREIRSLSRMNVVETLIAPAAAAGPAAPAPSFPAGSLRPARSLPVPHKRWDGVREREYPAVGADAYGALADDVAPYRAPAAEAPAPPPAEVESTTTAEERPAS